MIDSPGQSAGRIYALVTRHFYLLRKSVIRLGELVYWPTMQMIMWGYLAKYLAAQSGAAAGPATIALAPGLLIAALLAIAIHGYSIFRLGAPLAAFFANLMLLGWAFGLAAAALVLRYGLAAENFAWGFVFAIAPISGIYYPVSVLPVWLQPVALALPSTHVFEGMRAWSFTGVFRWDYFAAAAGLNVVYMALGAASFAWAFRRARELGLLLQSGE